MHPIFHLTLRTTDVERARAFYDRVLGPSARDVVELHAQAIARGARPHWLGFVAVAELDRAAADFTARGAEQLAKWVRPTGLEGAVFRDPGGAVVALGKPPTEMLGSAPAAAEVGGVLLLTRDVTKARANYAALFGWSFGATEDLGAAGIFHPFSWSAGQERVGAFTDVAGLADAHPHWLFQLRVDALDLALEAVRAGGGDVFKTHTLPSGHRGAVCHDPQGAAFALREDTVQPARDSH